MQWRINILMTSSMSTIPRCYPWTPEPCKLTPLLCDRLKLLSQVIWIRNVLYKLKKVYEAVSAEESSSGYKTSLSSFAKGDEGLHQPNCHTNLDIPMKNCLHFWHFINITQQLTTWPVTSRHFLPPKSSIQKSLVIAQPLWTIDSGIIQQRKL